MMKRETNTEMVDEREFNGLVGKIQTATQALRQDALGVINRSVTARAWLTGYYIVEFEQEGKARAAYGNGLLKRLSERLVGKDYSVHTLKKYREFYRIFPRLTILIRDYLVERFGKGYSANIQLPQIGQEGVAQSFPAIGESAITQFENGLLIENDDGGVEISTWALFNRISYTHMLQLPSKETLTCFLRKENEGLQAKGK